MSKHWKVLTGWSSIEGQWLKRRHFNAEMLAHLAEQIRKSEAGHTGELVLAIEAVMPPHEHDSYQRALEVFGRLRVWDTPLNSGVLLYLALDQRRIEIIADRGIQISDQAWHEVCQHLRHALAKQQYLSGLVEAVQRIQDLLRQGAPLDPAISTADDNHLSNAPVLL